MLRLPEWDIKRRLSDMDIKRRLSELDIKRRVSDSCVALLSLPKVCYDHYKKEHIYVAVALINTLQFGMLLTPRLVSISRQISITLRHFFSLNTAEIVISKIYS